MLNLSFAVCGNAARASAAGNLTYGSLKGRAWEKSLAEQRRAGFQSCPFSC